MKRFLIILLAVFMVFSMMPTVAFADYTYDNDAQTTWDRNSTVLVYNDSSIYDNMYSKGKMGLPNVNYNNLSDVKAVTDRRSIVPSVETALAASGDIINVEAQKTLYGMTAVVDHMQTKQITLGDMEAIMWSFIVSQFATPYQENVNDVLTHQIFQQMINQNLEIEASPSPNTGTVIWADVWKPNTEVVDTVKFGEIAHTLKNNLNYSVLYDGTGKNRVNLFTFLTSKIGSVYYIVDRQADFGEGTQEKLWNERGSLMTSYESDQVVLRDKLIPVYVHSNVTAIQNQINLGAFLKGQSALEPGDGSSGTEPTFANVIGVVDEANNTKAASGTMGPCDLYVDSFGNICVYHDNKMKIILCNAQNPIFTSRPDEDSTFRDSVKTTNGMQVYDETQLNNIIEITMTETADKLQSALNNIYTAEGLNADDAVTIKSNETMAVYSKPVLTVYSQVLSPGDWNSDASVHFSGDNVREDYPGYLEFKRAFQNSHRNQLIFFKAPRVDASKYNSDAWIISEKKITMSYANMDDPAMDGLSLKEELRFKNDAVWYKTIASWFSGMELGTIVPTQRTMYFGGWWLSNWLTGYKEDDEKPDSVRMSVLNTEVSNLSHYYFKKDIGASAWSWPAAMQTNLATIGKMDKWIYKDILTIFNDMMFAGMGFDDEKMIPGSLVRGFASDNDKDRTYTIGGLLTATLDYGQYWSLANEALAADASVAEVQEGSITALKGSDEDGEQRSIMRPGLMKPYNKIIWSGTKMEWERLISILEDYRAELGGPLTSNAMLALATNAEAGDENKPNGSIYDRYKAWTKDHRFDSFMDNVFLQLRDLRVSDQWVTYSKEEVALISYTWLNYYLPRGLYARTFIDETYEDTEMLRNFVINYNKGILDEKTLAAMSDEDLEKLVWYNFDRDKISSHPNIDGNDDPKWKPTTVILGPYQVLHGTDEDFSYNFYPDCSPFPSVLEVATMEGVVSESQVTTVKTNHVTVNVYDLLMGIYRNTNDDANLLRAEQRGPDIPVVDKNEILQGLYQFVKAPASTLISWISAILQSAHRSMANGSFASFFRLAWITDTKIWGTVFAYYFVIVLSLVGVASLYTLFMFMTDKTVGLFTTCKRLFTSVIMTVIPVLLINMMVYGLDITSKQMLNATLDKAAVVETGALIVGTSNANADFERYYQLFRQQFDSLEDVVGKYSYQVPVSYYESIDQFRYRSTDLQSMLYSTAWTSNQASPKWYDYRGFVPVQRENYKTDLYYYFYDYIKWQYLQYLATAPTVSSVRLQDRAKEYVFGAETKYTGPGDISKIQAECNDPELVIITEAEQAKFIENLEKLMATSVGDYYVMINDPNYIYGASFAADMHDIYGDYYLEDLFGLGYLLTDIMEYDSADSKTWEPSDELYLYPGWLRFRENSALKLSKVGNTQTEAHQNTKQYIDAQDKLLPPVFQAVGGKRDGRVYASKVPLMKSIGFDVRVTRGLPATDLENKLIALNQRIYDRILDQLRFFPESTPSEAYISLAAATASFEFTKAFGTGTIIQPNLEPTGFYGDSISLDSVMKGLFSHSTTDLLQSRELVYMLVDNAGGFGVASALLVVIADALAFAVVISRNILVTLIFGFAVALCIINYLIRRNHKHRILLGVTTQIVGLFLAHLITTLGLNLLTFYSVGSGTIWKDVMIAALMVLIFAADAIVHCNLLLMVMRDFGSFGGNIMASKLENLTASIKARLSGDTATNRAVIKDMRMEHESQVAEQEEQRAAANMERLNRTMGQLAQARQQGVDRGAMTATAGTAALAGAGMATVMNAAPVKMRRNAGLYTDNINGAPNVAAAAGTSNISGINIGSDTRLAGGAHVRNKAALQARLDELKARGQLAKDVPLSEWEDQDRVKLNARNAVGKIGVNAAAYGGMLAAQSPIVAAKTAAGAAIGGTIGAAKGLGAGVKHGANIGKAIGWLAGPVGAAIGAGLGGALGGTVGAATGGSIGVVTGGAASLIKGTGKAMQNANAVRKSASASYSDGLLRTQNMVGASRVDRINKDKTEEARKKQSDIEKQMKEIEASMIEEDRLGSIEKSKAALEQERVARAELDRLQQELASAEAAAGVSDGTETGENREKFKVAVRHATNSREARESSQITNSEQNRRAKVATQIKNGRRVYSNVPEAEMTQSFNTGTRKREAYNRISEALSNPSDSLINSTMRFMQAS